MLKKVATILGERLSNDIYEDIESLTGSYKNINTLTDFDLNMWLHNRNPILTSFLFACTGCSERNNVKKNLCIAGAVDSIYKGRKLNFVAPLPFCKNLLCYYISGSKLISQLNNRQEAAGSYSSLKRWLKNISKEPASTPDNYDIITFFDNSQTIVRNWRVNYAHKTKASVITTLVHIQPSLTPTLQNRDEFNPRYWLYNTNCSNTDIVKGIQEKIQVEENVFNYVRNTYIENRLKKVIGENNLTGSGYSDVVDDRIRGKYTVKLIKIYLHNIVYSV